jgi:uncharacterized protein DUF5615
MSAVRFLADHDLNEHIVDGVRRREPLVEFRQARDFGLQTRPDTEILDFASRECFLVVSHDVNTMTAAATQRLTEAQRMGGLLMVPQSSSVSDVIDSLVLIWSVSDSEDWRDQIVFLPL